MSHQHPSLTDLPMSPDDDRRRRMRNYLIMMGIRLVCILLLLVVPGWWKALPIVGAVVLPWLAVLFANATSQIATKTDRVVQREIGS